MIKHVIAIEHDGIQERVLTLSFKVPSEEFDLLSAIRTTVNDFLHTEEGKKVWIGNCHVFNWADFESNIDSSLCEAHGFSKIDYGEYCDYIVDWDEALDGGFELEDDDDNDNDNDDDP